MVLPLETAGPSDSQARAATASLLQSRNYAWGYFQLHASQRMTVFNFFVALAALLVAGVLATMQADPDAHPVGCVLSLVLTTVSFVFWKLDQRVRFLIWNAERALKDVERRLDPSMSHPSYTQLFLREAAETQELRAASTRFLWRRQLSYSKNFDIMFLLFGILGVVGAVASACFTLLSVA